MCVSHLRTLVCVRIFSLHGKCNLFSCKYILLPEDLSVNRSHFQSDGNIFTQFTFKLGGKVNAFCLQTFSTLKFILILYSKKEKKTTEDVKNSTLIHFCILEGERKRERDRETDRRLCIM